MYRKRTGEYPVLCVLTIIKLPNVYPSTLLRLIFNDV